MPHPHRKHCRRCGRHSDDCGPISWEGNCLDCGKAVMARNIDGIATRTGMPYRRWALGVSRYAQRLLLDATGESVHTDDHAD